MAQTKLQRVTDQLKQVRADLKLSGEVVDDFARIKAQLEDEVREADAINTRQGKTVNILMEKIGKLKEVARFFRAQRDRVDAYLNGVLDQIEPVADRAEPPWETLAKVDAAGPMVPVIPLTNRRRRPGVPEPDLSPVSTSQVDGQDGFQAYRDFQSEGTGNWENF